MGARRKFTDQFTADTSQAVAANANDEGVASSTGKDTILGFSPTFICEVTSLAANKTISLKVQESDELASGYEDAPDVAANKVDVTANGIHKLFYAGEKRYARVQVVSTSAAPAASVRVQYQLHNLRELPENASF